MFDPHVLVARRGRFAALRKPTGRELLNITFTAVRNAPPG